MRLPVVFQLQSNSERERENKRSVITTGDEVCIKARNKSRNTETEREGGMEYIYLPVRGVREGDSRARTLSAGNNRWKWKNRVDKKGLHSCAQAKLEMLGERGRKSARRKSGRRMF